MKNPRIDILKAYLTALNGITYNGQPVKVYTIPPKGMLNPYIMLTNLVGNNYDDMFTFSHSFDIDVEVITQFSGNWGAPDAAEEITNSVCEALLPTRTSVLPLLNFKMVTMYHSNQIDDQTFFDSNRGYRVTTTFTMVLDEVKDFGDCWLASGVWSSSGIWGSECVWNSGN